MGLSYVDCQVENVRQPRKKATVPHLLVDTGSLHTWIPAEVLRRLGIGIDKPEVPFVMANGQIVNRPMGGARLRASGFETLDDVVFAQPGDLCLLGARTLEGFGALVDPGKEKLVAAGPAPVATAQARDEPTSGPQRESRARSVKQRL